MISREQLAQAALDIEAYARERIQKYNGTPVDAAYSVIIAAAILSTRAGCEHARSVESFSAAMRIAT